MFAHRSNSCVFSPAEGALHEARSSRAAKALQLLLARLLQCGAKEVTFVKVLVSLHVNIYLVTLLTKYTRTRDPRSKRYSHPKGKQGLLKHNGIFCFVANLLRMEHNLPGSNNILWSLEALRGLKTSLVMMLICARLALTRERRNPTAALLLCEQMREDADQGFFFGEHTNDAWNLGELRESVQALRRLGGRTYKTINATGCAKGKRASLLQIEQHAVFFNYVKHCRGVQPQHRVLVDIFAQW
ncbi:hypothetical protein AK812_SmicGene43381 [Symbiodinium microadriaticum]|uniref:Uncharacterized protein n=1 Tax=Symbiodinium microadriaticum TaxID=2951 RepID=A0A1Q9C166_SYMMI|nr:hypothetical protein AK812_SmicGene43381 [Symbiodinium microadriaticum]CAE7253489.1 unnamed protein product [Symbiodinium sp. KB8]CAE7263286.1 unnamed protein product [Symbiodinium microadriaticum]